MRRRHEGQMVNSEDKWESHLVLRKVAVFITVICN